MKPLIAILSIAALAGFVVGDTLGRLERRQDGIWLVYSNLPPHWTFQRTTNLYDWDTVLEGYTNFPLVEVKLQSGFEMIFYRLEAKP